VFSLILVGEVPIDFVAVALGLLAGVFCFSGATKILRPLPAAMAMVRFGLIPWPRPAAGRTAGAIELGAGVALAAWPARLEPAIFAAVLLTLFTALIARAVARGDQFNCACFGSQGSTSGYALVRTALLTALAIACVALVARGVYLDLSVRLVGIGTGGLMLSTAILVAEIRRLAPFESGFSNNE